MTSRWRTGAWMACLVTGGGMAVLGTLFVWVGLDDADKYASVVGGLGAVAGLGLSVFALTCRSPAGQDSAEMPSSPAGQWVRASAVDGDVVQIDQVTGDVDITTRCR